MSAGRRRQEKGKKHPEAVAESPQEGSVAYVQSPAPHLFASPLREERSSPRRLFSAETTGGGGQDVPEDTAAQDLEPELPRKASESVEGRTSDHELVRAQIVMTGHNLAARDESFLHGSSSDPYLLFKQAGTLVGQTEVIQHNLNPVWQPVSVTLALGRNVFIECMDKDEDSQDDVVGEAEVTAERLLLPGATIPLLFEQQDAGVLRVLDVRLVSPQRVGRPEPSTPHRSEGPQRIRHGCMEAVSWSETVPTQQRGMIWDHAIAGSPQEIWDHDIADSWPRSCRFEKS